MKPLLLLAALLAWGGASAADFTLTTIGNSITLSKPDISKGWSGRWGMAATAEKNDYSAQLAALIEEHIGRAVDLARINHAELERSNEYIAMPLYAVERARRSDVLVVELGDNALGGNDGASEFGTRYARFLAEVSPRHGLLVCIGTWWRKSKLDAEIRQQCVKRGGTFVDLRGLIDREALRGSRDTGATDAGVLSHPGDAGMEAISAATYRALESKLPVRGRASQ